MKKILFYLSLILSSSLIGQDIGVTQITSPVTGCALSSTESVVVKIFNYGTNMSGVPFDVSYTINGGPAQTDVNVTFPSFLTNSTVTYTVSIPANLSTPGTYTLTATASVAGDINPTNDFVSGYTVTSLASTVGGTISGDTNVCVSGNSGVLTLNGYTGDILNWEYSVDNGINWLTLSNTTNSQSYSNLTSPRKYRVKVQNPGCSTAYSDTASMTIDPATVGGSVSGTSTKCISGNSGTMTLTGKVGNVLSWQFSTNGGSTWTSIANTTTSQSYLNLVQTTMYRAVVKSGACATVLSGSATITISPLSVGGTVSSNDTVCSGSNSGTLTLAGSTGSRIWQISTNNGATFSNVAPLNTSPSLTFTNINDTVRYRVRVTSGACPTMFSDTVEIVVTPPTIPGTVSSSSTVCSGSNADTLALSGQSGNIIGWESSTDGGTTWTNIVNTNDSLIYSNISTNTVYRALVQQTGCNILPSVAATITVNNPSVGGTVSTNTTVCASGNSGNLTLSGQTGSIQHWLSSDNSGSAWDTIVNTTTNQSFSNLTDTTIYVAIVKNGVCPSDTSDTVTVFVDAVTMGGTVSASSSVCYGNNSDTLNIVGNNGAVQSWEFSIDNGVTWVSLSNTTTAQPFSNITDNTIFRAIVQNGTCAPAYTGQATITVSPVAVGGTLYGGTTVCSNSNSGTLTLIGYNSNVVQWQASLDSGTTWLPIVNTTAFENFNNLSQTTWYQAIVSSGVCPNDTSSVAVVSVDTMSVGGAVTASDTVCSGMNGDTLVLTGNIGVVTGWQMSSDGGSTWIALANQGNSQTYANLNATTMFRTEVKNGVCAAATSAPATISVDAVAVGGTISGGTTVCVSGNSGVLSLAGYSTNVIRWESSNDGGASWTPIANTTNTESFNNLTDTTWYHAIVGSGVCPNDTSSSVTVYVDTLSVGGVVSADDTICAGQNGTLTLSGQIGSVTNWQMSTDGGLTWTPLLNTNATQNYSNLNTTTVFRAEVKNGVCASATSDSATITVDPVAVGGTITGGATVCSSGNSGALTLSGYNTNVIQWESSTDGGTSWSAITNTTSSETYNNLTDTTWYRAIVGSGVCPNDTSSVATIYVDTVSVGGAVSADDTVCVGQNGVLTLSGNIGTITSWQMSTDGGSTWTPLLNNSATQGYSNLSNTTLFRAEVKNGVCPAATSVPATITVDQLSVAGTISSAATVCEASNNGTLSLSGTNGSILDWQMSNDGGQTWTSLTNTTTLQTYTNLTDTTWYRSIAKNGVCSADTGAPVIITVMPKPNAQFTATDTCFGIATVFSNSTTIQSGYVQLYTWDFGDNNGATNGNPAHMYSDTGSYNVTLVALSNAGCLDTVIVPVSVFGLPSTVFSTSGSLEFCNGDSITISVPSIPTNTYIWNTGAVVSSITVDTTGTWTLVVTDTVTGCTNSDSITTVVSPLPTVNAGVDDTISLGNSITLSGSGSGTFNWSPSATLDIATSQNPVATPTTTTTYTLAVTNINGCSATDSVRIVVEQGYEFVIHTVITPNGDGFNDVWNIRNIEFYPNNEVIIFNRYGQKVFGMTGYDNSWDGTFGGSPVPDGTYYYVLKFSDSDKNFTGAITVLRGSK